MTKYEYWLLISEDEDGQDITVYEPTYPNYMRQKVTLEINDKGEFVNTNIIKFPMYRGDVDLHIKTIALMTSPLGHEEALMHGVIDVSPIHSGGTLQIRKGDLVIEKKGTEKALYVIDVEQLRSWAYAYYELDEPLATDEEYDLLYHKVMKYEMRNDITNPKSPTQFVGWVE